MLNVIFDRMAASCTDSLQPMAGTPCYFSVNGITNDRVGDIIKDYEANAVAAVLYAEQWDTRIIIMLDRDFVFTMVEAMFGSDGAEPPLDVERSLLQYRDPSGPGAVRAVRQGAAILLRRHLRRHLPGGAGRDRDGIAGDRPERQHVDLREHHAAGALPRRPDVPDHSALRAQPARQKLATVVVSDGRAADPRWREQMESEVHRTEVTLSAVLDEKMISLGDVAKFQVGQVLELEATPRTLAQLESNNQVLFWCQIGQLDGYYAMQVADPVDQKREFVDDILSR